MLAEAHSGRDALAHMAPPQGPCKAQLPDSSVFLTALCDLMPKSSKIDGI